MGIQKWVIGIILLPSILQNKKVNEIFSPINFLENGKKIPCTFLIAFLSIANKVFLLDRQESLKLYYILFFTFCSVVDGTLHKRDLLVQYMQAWRKLIAK